MGLLNRVVPLLQIPVEIMQASGYVLTTSNRPSDHRVPDSHLVPPRHYCLIWIEQDFSCTHGGRESEISLRTVHKHSSQQDWRFPSHHCIEGN